MSKKMYFLISFVLVLCLAGNVLAYDVMMWDNYEGGGDRLWTTSTNWYVDGSSPLERRAPIGDDWVCIDFYADDANGPIINRGMDVTGGEWLGLGDYYPPIDVNEPVTLTMTGGRLTIGDWLSMGFYYEGIYRWDMSGGTIDLQGADGFTLGRGDLEEVGDGPYVTFNMSDGDFKCGAWLDIGAYNTAQADFNMTGGTFNVAMDLRIGAYEPNFVEWYGGARVIKATGKGHLALHGGTMTVAGNLAIGGGFGEGTMDIANDGTLILQGDYRQANGLLFDPCSDDPNNVGDHSGTIAILAKRGIITAYNTQVGDIITDGNYPSVVGKRAVINLDYDVPSAGWSTLTARALDPNLAWDPDPSDGTGDINSPALTLSWLPGENAASHEVYFGTSRGDVTSATTSTAVIYRGSGSVAGPDGDGRYSYVIPGGDLPLVFGKSYFWRIDEVNSTNTWKGDVWSFDVEGKAKIVYPADGAVEIPFVNLTLLWEAGVGAGSHDVYFGSDEAAVEDANTANTALYPGVYRGNQALSDVNYALEEDLDYLQSYYWRIDEVNTGTFAEGHVWSFTTAPARATNPSPEDGAREVSPVVVLSWYPGPEADEHHVYLSTDLEDVIDRDPSVLTVRDTNNYAPGALELDARYYWAVDEVNNLEEPNVWPGKVWDFRTAEYLPVDDFESYVNTGILNDTWHDWTDPGASGGQYNAEVVYETDTVHDGGKSMLYKYHDQDYPGFSESWAYASDLGAGTDWTVGGVKALRLYFYGDPGNSGDPVYDRMWVGLEDGSGTFALVNYDDMNDVTEPEWHEWAIRVQDFNDINNVDLTDVSKIYIGFGDRAAQGDDGTEGEVYFDDIQIWPPFCWPEKVETDFTGDCITDYEDVEVMARDWLISDSNLNVTPVPPAFAPQIWYRLDEGSGDTINNDGNLGATHNGIFTGDPNNPTWTTDAHPDDGNALSFDGVDDYVVVKSTTGRPSDTFSFGGWFKTSVTHEIDPESTTGAVGTEGQKYAFWPEQRGPDNGGAGLSVGTNGISVCEHGDNYMPAIAVYEAEIGNDWNHIMVAYNNKQPTIYLNGLPVRIGLTSPRAMVDAPIQFGGGDYGWFEGLIDDVRIYDKCLTTDEMMYLAGGAGGTFYVPIQATPANLVPKVPPGGPFDPDNLDIVNFRDYAILAKHWLEGPTLWP